MTELRGFAAAFRQGDPAAFQSVIDRCGRTVRAIAGRYFKSVFEQEEAMQDIWVHLYSVRDRLDPERSHQLEAWVATVARNRCLDLLRARKRREGRRDDVDVEAVGVDGPAGNFVEESAISRAVAGFTAQLEPEWARFFRLHFVQGLGYPDISRELGVSRIRCRYMKTVLVKRARQDAELLAALGREAS